MAFGIGTSSLYATIRALPKFYAVSPSVLFWLMGAFLFFILALSFFTVIFWFKFRLRWYMGFPLLAIYAIYFVLVVLYETNVIWKNSTVK